MTNYGSMGLVYLILGCEMDKDVAFHLKYAIMSNKKDLEEIVRKKERDPFQFEGPDGDYIALFNKKEIEKLNLILCKTNYKSLFDYKIIFGWIIGYLGSVSKINLDKLKHSKYYKECIRSISKKDIQKLKDFLKERALSYTKGPAGYLCEANQSKLYVSIWR